MPPQVNLSHSYKFLDGWIVKAAYLLNLGEQRQCKGNTSTNDSSL